MKDISVIFRNKKVSTAKLAAYGFKEKDGAFIKDLPFTDGEMSLRVECGADGIRRADVYDLATGDIYSLHLVGAEGEFVGRVRREYEEKLEAVARNCFDDAAFRYPQTADALNHAKVSYGDEPEFLWDNSPDCAILRRKDSGKWYAVIMTVRGDKFGHDPQCDEIIDLRADPGDIDRITDGINYFRGYHMNKKHWLTIVLDGSVDAREIYARMDRSYALAGKK